MGFVEEMNAVYEQAGGSLCETDTDLLLAIQTNDRAEQERLTKQIYTEFWKTEVGRQLKSLSTNQQATATALMKAFAKRFGEDSPLYIFRLTDVAKDLIAADADAAPVPPKVNLTFDPPQPSDAQKHAALVEQVRRDMQDPKVPSITINERRKSSVAYERAFQDANTPDAVAAKSKAPSEIVQFAHMANETIRDFGISALRPHVGIVTIQAGGKRYEYELADFRRLFEQATQHGLIR